ncbi:hypothetical protein B7463_g8526, partial [Scytalidium lignicola]
MGWLPDFQAKVEFTSLDTHIQPAVRTLRFRPSCVSYKIGRASKSLNKGIVAAKDNAWFDSPVMSRNHAEIYISPDIDSIMLKDIGSLHGTFLNGTQVDRLIPTPLNPGDTVVFGAPVARNGETFPPCSFEVSIDFHDKTSHSNTFTLPPSSDIEDEPYNITSDEDKQKADMEDSSDASSIVEEVFVTKVTSTQNARAESSTSLLTANDIRDHIIIDSDDEEIIASSDEDQRSEVAESELSDSESEDIMANEIEDLEEQATGPTIQDSEIIEYSESNLNITASISESNGTQPSAQNSYGIRFEVPEEISDDEIEDKSYDPDAKLEDIQDLSDESQSSVDNPWLQASADKLNARPDESYKSVAGTDDLHEVLPTKLPEVVMPPQHIRYGSYSLAAMAKSDLPSSLQSPGRLWEEVGSNITDNMSEKKEFFDAWAENKETLLKHAKATAPEHDQFHHNEIDPPMEREFSPAPFYGYHTVAEQPPNSEFDMTSAVTFNKSKQLTTSSNSSVEPARAIPTKLDSTATQPHRSKVSINDIIDCVSAVDSSTKKRKIDLISDSVEDELPNLAPSRVQSTESDSPYQRPMKKLKSVAEIAGWVALGGIGLFSVLVATAPEL